MKITAPVRSKCTKFEFSFKSSQFLPAQYAKPMGLTLERDIKIKYRTNRQFGYGTAEMFNTTLQLKENKAIRGFNETLTSVSRYTSLSHQMY